jgi:hypothetical protein
MTIQPLAFRDPTSSTFQITPAVRRLIERYFLALAAISLWGAQPRRLAAMDDIQHRNNRPGSSLSRGSVPAPGGIFDPLFSGIWAHAAGISAAICRQPSLRRHL